MPALVKRSVGSSPGTSDEEHTRVWPLRSKYCRNFSRSSAPVIGRPIVTPRLSPRPGGPRTRGRRAPPAARRSRGAGGGLAGAPRQGRQPPAGDCAGALELAVVVHGGQRRLDQRGRDAARPELRAQARRSVAARGAGGDPVAGEGLVVEIAAGGEVGDHVVGDGRGRAAPPQPRGESARGPGAPGQEVGGHEPRGPRVEGSARTARARYDLLKKELPAGETGARSVVRCSNDCSPVEKMPRTLRSKSSALVAASRAVS